MALSDIDKLLDRLHHPIEKLLVIPNNDPALSLLKKVDKKQVYGRGLTAYKPLKLKAGGAFARGSEGGSLPSGNSSTSVEGSYKVHKLFFSMDFTDEEIKAMAGGRDKLHTTMQGEITDAFNVFKARQGAMFFGRGDGCIGRVNGAVSSDTEVTLDGPILAVEDDTLLGYTTRGTDTAGSLSSAGTVDFVDHENNKLYLVSAASMADNEVLAYSGGALDQSSSKFQWPAGLQQHLDDVNNTAWWDTGDDADYDHVDTYLGKDRATYRKLNCLYKAASSATVNEYWISMPASLVQGQRVDMGRIMYICNPKMYRRIVKYFSGQVRISRGEEWALPGGKQKFDVITGIGTRGVPVLQSYYMPDGAIACVCMDDFEQLTTEGDWVKNGGSRMLLVPDGSGSYSHKYRFSHALYWNTACTKPYRQAVVAGLSTTDD